MATKPKKHYVDNQRFFEEIVEYKKKVKASKEQGLEKPRVSEYMGSCILMMAERLSTKPRFMNYSFREEMISDALENCFLYFDNFDPEKSQNPFAYFTQIIYYAFHRRISKEEKNRYIIYKKFQESVLHTSDASLMIDSDDNHLLSSTVYDNINDFIGKFEKRESEKKEKRKQVKQGLENFVEGENDEGRESV